MYDVFGSSLLLHSFAKNGKHKAWPALVEALSGSEGLLRRVHDVEEAVLVPLPAVQVCHGGGERGQGRLVHQQEERLLGVQLEAAPGEEK